MRFLVKTIDFYKVDTVDEVEKLHEELKNSNYTYAADTKVPSSHDDIVMATALACSCYMISKKGQSDGSYLIRGR